MTQTISFTVTDPGDPSAGLMSFREEVSLQLKFGGHDEDTVAELMGLIAMALTGVLGHGNCKVEGRVQ